VGESFLAIRETGAYPNPSNDDRGCSIKRPIRIEVRTDRKAHNNGGVTLSGEMAEEESSEEAKLTCGECKILFQPSESKTQSGWFWARFVAHRTLEVIYAWGDGSVTDRRGKLYHAGHWQVVKKVEEPKREEFPGFERVEKKERQ